MGSGAFFDKYKKYSNPGTNESFQMIPEASGGLRGMKQGRATTVQEGSPKTTVAAGGAYINIHD